MRADGLICEDNHLAVVSALSGRSPGSHSKLIITDWTQQSGPQAASANTSTCDVPIRPGPSVGRWPGRNAQLGLALLGGESLPD